MHYGVVGGVHSFPHKHFVMQHFNEQKAANRWQAKRPVSLAALWTLLGLRMSALLAAVSSAAISSAKLGKLMGEVKLT